MTPPQLDSITIPQGPRLGDLVLDVSARVRGHTGLKTGSGPIDSARGCMC